MLPEGVGEAPWDARVLGVPAFELTALSQEAVQWLQRTAGFFTLKLPSASPKGEPERYGFYYCDTLLCPSCVCERFVPHDDGRCSLTGDFDLDAVLAMVPGAFTHDRFHKDARIPPALGDDRYVRWLRDLQAQGRLRAFLWERRELAGFWGYTAEGVVVLHALASGFRGRGLAKHFWTAGCRMLFDQGFRTLASSVSASNLAVMNLYSSLGFSMKDAVDVYHLFK